MNTLQITSTGENSTHGVTLKTPKLTMKQIDTAAKELKRLIKESRKLDA